MKILVLPLFELNRDGNIEQFFINDRPPKEQQNINTRLLQMFASDELFPGRNVYRLGDTNFYVIFTLPTESIEDIKNIYFSNLQDVFNTTTTINNKIIPTVINFFTLDDKIDITDSEISDDDYRNDMKDNGYQLNELTLDNLFLSFTNYSGSNFFETSLINAQCSDAQFVATNFSDTILSGANFDRSDLRYADFINADLTVLTIEGQAPIKTSLVGANLKHADLSGADFTGADLSGADLRMATFNAGTNFTGCKLTGTKFAKTNWQITIHDEPMVGALFEMLERSPEEEALMRSKLALADAEADEYEEADEDDKDTCFYAYGYYDINIQKYLEKHPDNFVVEYGGNVTCESLTNLKKMFYDNGEYEIYYECSAENIKTTAINGFTPLSFTPADYYTEKAYVKISPTTNIFVEKQDWMYEGPVPEPRRFRLVATGVQKRLIAKSLTISDTDVVSGVHCDPLDTFEIYRLELISTGGRRKQYIIKRKNITKKKNITKRKNITKKRHIRKKNIKKTKHKKILKKKTRSNK